MKTGGRGCSRIDISSGWLKGPGCAGLFFVLLQYCRGESAYLYGLGLINL